MKIFVRILKVIIFSWCSLNLLNFYRGSGWTEYNFWVVFYLVNLRFIYYNINPKHPCTGRLKCKYFGRHLSSCSVEIYNFCGGKLLFALFVSCFFHQNTFMSIHTKNNNNLVQKNLQIHKDVVEMVKIPHFNTFPNNFLHPYWKTFLFENCFEIFIPHNLGDLSPGMEEWNCNSFSDALD